MQAHQNTIAVPPLAQSCGSVRQRKQCGGFNRAGRSETRQTLPFSEHLTHRSPTAHTILLDVRGRMSDAPRFPALVPAAHPRPKLLVMEFWGLGDLTFSTPLLRAAERDWEVTLVGKAHARPLLAPSFPALRFSAFDAPWSAYRDKYALWKWPWRELLALIWTLRRERFDAAVSVRNDPRDHLLMALVGARERIGFPLKGSHVFLTRPLIRSKARQHKVEDWRDLGRALALPGIDTAEPRLVSERYRSSKVDGLLAAATASGAPLLCLHPGARILVRRWPEPFFAEIVARLRQHFHFHLLLIPDPDGYGGALAPLADTVLPPLAVHELVDVLRRVDLLLCNDSGPGHLAASCGRPAMPVFGPTDPDWFRPWGNDHAVLIRDICPWRPCFDYCKFSEPYCLTKLHPDMIWPDIREHIGRLIESGVLPRALRRRASALELVAAVG